MSSKQTKAQKILQISGEIEKSVRAEEAYLQDAIQCDAELTEAKRKHVAQVEVTKILKLRLEAETATMRKARGE